jgi:hypothetical protein
MTCRERRDAIFLFAADALEESEERELAAHLASGCLRCAGALADAREALALIAQSLAPVPPPAGSRERLLARIGASPRAAAAAATGAAAVRALPAPRRSPLWRRAAIAASIGLVVGASAGTLASWRWLLAPLSAERTALERELAAAREDAEELARAVAEQDRDLAALEDETRLAAEALRLLRTDDLEVMQLSAGDSAGGASARIFWDRATYGCYFHAEGMTAPTPGRRYVLWLVTARGEPLAAGSFAPDAHGEATVVTRLPRQLAPIVRALVTEEAGEHGETPAGDVRLQGSATRLGRS